MSALTEARDELCALLRADGIDAYPYLPATISPPCVVIYPSDPYVEPGTLTPDGRFRASVNYTLACIAQALDNEAGLALCESLLVDVITALPPGVVVGRATRPGLDDTGAQGALYVTELSITVQLEDPTTP